MASMTSSVAATRFTVVPCPLGHVLVAVSARGVCRVTMGDSAALLQADWLCESPQANRSDHDADVQRALAQVLAAMRGQSLGSAPELDVQGTAFQQRVWRALQEIPRGSTSTYAALAAAIGAPRAVRAVGTACGANPVAVLIPCHRVVRADGSLGGYRWGLSRKQQLLQVEQAS